MSRNLTNINPLDQTEHSFSIAGSSLTLTKSGIIKNFSGNNYIIQPLEFSQTFLVADLENKTVTTQFHSTKFPNFFAACMRNDICHMTGGTITQTIQFHYSLSPFGNVDRLADMI